MSEYEKGKLEGFQLGLDKRDEQIRTGTLPGAETRRADNAINDKLTEKLIRLRDALRAEPALAVERAEADILADAVNELEGSARNIHALDCAAVDLKSRAFDAEAEAEQLREALAALEAEHPDPPDDPLRVAARAALDREGGK